jgi:exosortase
VNITAGKRLIGPSLAGLVFLALYIPVIVWLAGVWLDNPYYTHGFLVLPISAFIAWTRRDRLVRTRPDRTGVLVFVAGLVFYVIGFLLKLYWLWGLSLPVVLSGILLYFGGPAAFRTMLFPVVFLVFMIPLPFLDQVGTRLQSLTAAGSTWFAQVFGIPATRTGAEISLPDAAFSIGVPCSGMNTLISLLALSALLLYCLDSPFYKKLSLFILAVPIAILANLVRVVLLLVIAHTWGSDAAINYFHDYSSLLLFILAVLLLLLLARLMRCRFKSFAELLHGQ